MYFPLQDDAPINHTESALWIFFFCIWGVGSRLPVSLSVLGGVMGSFSLSSPGRCSSNLSLCWTTWGTDS